MQAPRYTAAAIRTQMDEILNDASLLLHKESASGIRTGCVIAAADAGGFL